MGFGIITIVHAVLALMLIIELGLTAYVVSVTDVHWFGVNSTPSQFSFMLFNSIWSILVLIYIGLATSFITQIYHSIVAVVLLGLSTIFWFAGSIAMAAFIGVPSCHGNNFCQSAQAAVAFGFFIWVAFTGLFVVELLAFLRGGSRATAAQKPGQTYP